MAQSHTRSAGLNLPNEDALDGIDLVIFDFDGVIADSEVLSLGTLRDALSDSGLHMPLERVRALFLGKSIASIQEYIAEHGPAGASDDFAHRWQSALYERLGQELEPMPAILPFLECLIERDIRYCVASSSTFERIQLSMSAMNLEDRFFDVFSAEQVQNGKPAPDLFLFAAKQVGANPGACLVIEDSPHGIQGAKAAGMRAIGFLNGAHLTDIRDSHATLLLDAGAESVLNDFAELYSAQMDVSVDAPQNIKANDT